MRRRLVIFSTLLFFVILTVTNTLFIKVMDQTLHDKADGELSKILEIERLKMGGSMDTAAFAQGLYQSYPDNVNIFFFNANGEIIGAKNAKNPASANRKMSDELGHIGEKIVAKAHLLDTEKTYRFHNNSKKHGTIVVGKVPDLNWYVAVIIPLDIKKAMKTDMAMLFKAVMVIIAFIFIAFNLFILGLLKPLNKMVNNLNQISADCDMQPHKNEMETLGEFFDMAIIDPLTGVYNRRYMEGSLKKLIKTLSRKNDKLSLLMIDVDHFKKYNDAYGHDMGDKCLKAVADVLRQNVTRAEDFVARYGGEEFVVVLPGTDENGAQLIADKLLQKIHECNIPHEKSDVADRVTFSIGGATIAVENSQNGTDYIKHADKALYESKRDGRNRSTHLALSH
jgi:diguanylate cyclase (GGDEF)-like protein